jgi:hypothetical protein
MIHRLVISELEQKLRPAWVKSEITAHQRKQPPRKPVNASVDRIGNGPEPLVCVVFREPVPFYADMDVKGARTRTNGPWLRMGAF